jgi:hypothetical protein
MSVRLRDIRNCFEGVIPSIIATIDADGTPNLSYLSQVFYLDDCHVALSNQYFSKTWANIQRNGTATVIVVDGNSGAQYELSLAFRRSEAAGTLFERMHAHLKALYGESCHKDVMVLRSADIYEVIGAAKVIVPSAAAALTDTSEPVERLGAAATVSAALADEGDFDGMVDRALDGLIDEFGFAHAMVLIADETGQSLINLASRGYDRIGVGAQVPVGEGTLGIATTNRRPVRLSDMSRGRRYVSAAAGVPEEQGRVIALPDIPEPQSQLAVPMIWQGSLRGMIFAESRQRFAFTHEDETAVTLIATQLAAGLAALGDGEMSDPAPLLRPQTVLENQTVFTVRYFDYDDSLFIDDAYIIKGLPGRLLYHFLRCFAESGRRDFSNREVRLVSELKLPDIKDNLETRLILLRRRLEERGAPVRLARPGRGLIRLELQGVPRIELVKDRP